MTFIFKTPVLLALLSLLFQRSKSNLDTSISITLSILLCNTAMQAATHHERTAAISPEDVKTNEVSSTHYHRAVDHKTEREWTSDAPPSYTQSSNYPIPSLSVVQTTL